MDPNERKIEENKEIAQAEEQDRIKDENSRIEAKKNEVHAAVATISFYKEKQSILDIHPPIFLEGYQYNRTNIDEMNRVFWPVHFKFISDGSCKVTLQEQEAIIIPGDYVVRDVTGKMLFIHKEEFEKRFEKINL